MDSMRSLNTSLPGTSNARQRPSEDLLSSFKAAALSVTTLYKVAAADQVRARAAGYQDALEDLLNFMERDRIGFTDGEGSRVRQWAIERIDGSQAATRAESDVEEEDEVCEDDKIRASSPEYAMRPPPSHQVEESALAQSDSTAIRPPTVAAAIPDHNISMTRPASQAPTRDFAAGRDHTFTFQSPHQYPTNHDREGSMDRSSVTSDQTHKSGPVRVEVLPRPSRNRQHRNMSSRSNSSNTNRSGLIANNGSKRRFGDFFDLSGLSFDPKDFDRPAGKKARHS